MSSDKRVVLLACGSFNPVTNMHLRMFEIGKDHLVRLGYSVAGGLISPVNDNYPKEGLASAKHRCQMVELALRTTDWIRLDKWESDQDAWVETVKVLQHHQRQLQVHTSQENNLSVASKKQRLDIPNLSINSINDANTLNNERGNANKGWDLSQEACRVKLLCGADLLESFSVPGLWKQEHILEIVSQYGLVVITRNGSNPEKFIYNNDILFQYQNNIHIVTEWIQNDISSTHIRRAVKRGESVRYLIQDSVIGYMKSHNLYKAGDNKYSCFLTPSPNYDVSDQFCHDQPGVHNSFALHQNEPVDVEQETAV